MIEWFYFLLSFAGMIAVIVLALNEADKEIVIIAFLFTSLFNAKHGIAILMEKVKEIERRLGTHHE